ncbi:transposase [Streptomyces sp. TLI_55]|nr:transposase [Streptomyces sp. TLI_55]
MQLTDEEWEFIEPYLPIGEYGPYPERLRQQFEGVIWRFKAGGQWREMPQEFGAWPTVHHRFRQWRDAGVFGALLEGLIAEAAKRGEIDLSLVSVDSTTARRSLPVTDDLRRSHPPTTSPSTPNPAHTRHLTCGFTMHTADSMPVGKPTRA